MPKLYADVTARRTAQIVADVFVVCWVALSLWLGRTVSNGISELRGPVDDLTSAGDSIRDNMAGAADNVGGVPLVGDSLRGPFDAISSAGPEHRRHRGVPRHDRRPGVPRGRGPARRRPDRPRPRGLGGPADPIRPTRERRPALVEPSRGARTVRAPGPDPTAARPIGA